MESAQIECECECIFRTLPFLYDTGIIKLIAPKDQFIHLHIRVKRLLIIDD